MTSRIVILGGGTGGTLTANRLRRLCHAEEAEITVVDQDDRHVYQPGLLFVPFGLTHAEDIVRPRERQLHDGIGFVESGIDHVDIEANEVHLTDGTALAYDVLVVATGARLVPEETEGLTGPGWMEKVFTFYTPEGAAALGAALATFDRRPAGRERGRHADQVPGRSARVLLPGRLVLHRARHPRPGRRSPTPPRSTAPSPSPSPPASSAGCSPNAASSWSPSSTPARSTAPAVASSATTGARSPSTSPSVIPLHGGADLRRPVPGPGRRARLRPHRRAHPAGQGGTEHLRHRRRRERPRLQGRLGHPLRRRDARRQRRSGSSPASPSRRASTGTPTASSRPGSTRPC